MQLFKRLHRITIGRIEAFLDRVENPETVFPVLIEEMEGQLAASAEAEARAAADLKLAQRDLARQREKVERFGKGAALALQKGEEETARMSLEAQMDAERVLEHAQKNVDRATDALDHAVASRRRIQEQLRELHSKKGEILTRARVVRAQQKVYRTVGAAGAAGSILDSVARLESRIEEAEAVLEIQSGLNGEAGNGDLDKRLRDLGRNDEIERRLDALRAEVAAGK